jgi:hypothetical protein
VEARIVGWPWQAGRCGRLNLKVAASLEPRESGYRFFDSLGLTQNRGRDVPSLYFGAELAMLGLRNSLLQHV